MIRTNLPRAGKHRRDAGPAPAWSSTSSRWSALYGFSPPHTAVLRPKPVIRCAPENTMNQLASIRIFAKVAECLNFAEAAKQLGISGSVVTRAVATLEEHLG